MKVIGSTAYNFEIINVTYTFLTIDMVKNCSVIFTFGIEGVFLVRFQRNSKMFKDPNQVMASRFAYVYSLAAIARVLIKNMRTQITWYLVFESKKILQPIIALENHRNFALWKVFLNKFLHF